MMDPLDGKTLHNKRWSLYRARDMLATFSAVV